jgi:hypothetical protein
MVAVPGFPRPLSECVIGSRIGKNGYARYPGGRRGVQLYAHRVEYERAYGSIPDGYHVHHVCGTKACINPEHLQVLSPADHCALRRQCDHDDRYVKPSGQSYCRRCHNERQRPRERDRYRTDPEFRAMKISRSAATRASRKEVMPNV